MVAYLSVCVRSASRSARSFLRGCASMSSWSLASNSSFGGLSSRINVSQTCKFQSVVENVFMFVICSLVKNETASSTSEHFCNDVNIVYIILRFLSCHNVHTPPFARGARTLTENDKVLCADVVIRLHFPLRTLRVVIPRDNVIVRVVCDSRYRNDF